VTLQAIKEAIKHLPEEERREFAGWFEGTEEAAWDEEIKWDFSPGGNGERLVTRSSGKSRTARPDPSKKALRSDAARVRDFRR
jgi:hypothetical protein